MTQLKVSSLFAAQLNNHALSLNRIGNFIDAERCLNRALLVAAMKERPDAEDYTYIEQERQEQRNQQENIPHVCSKAEGEYNSEGMRVFCDPIYIQISSTSDEKTIQKAIFYNLGVGYMWLQEYDESYAYFTKALSLHTPCNNTSKTEDSGFQGPNDVAILHNLGYVNFIQGRYSEAFSNYNEALRILQKSKGFYHPDVATCFNSIGITMMHSFTQDNADGEKAVGFFTEALAIYDAISSGDASCIEHVDIVMNNIARIKAVIREIQEQEKVAQQCSRFGRESFQSPAIAIS